MTENTAAPEKKSAKRIISEMLAQTYQDAFEAKAKGEIVGWVSSNFPQEILEVLDIKALYPENHAAAVAAKKGGIQMCEYSEGQGYSNDICSYARINLALSDLKECEQLNMPLPDVVLCCNNICSQMVNWYETLSLKLNVPMVLIDIPYNTNYEVSPELREYVKQQIYYAIRQLEKITGKEFDFERFDEVMKISSECGKAWLRACSYMGYEPSPINGFDVFNNMALAVCARGRQSTADVFNQLADEYEELVQSNKTLYKAKEQHRMLFDGIACFPNLRYQLQTLMQYGINLTGSVYGDAFAYIYDDLDGMVDRYCSTPNAVNFEHALDLRLNAINTGRCDSAVLHMNRSCKCWSGFIYEMERQIREKAGIPTVVFDGDQADGRNFSEAQFETRIQGLYEVLEGGEGNE